MLKPMITPNSIDASACKRLLLLLLFCFLMPAVWAQEFSLSGRVTSQDNQPISGASIQVKGKPTSTSTANDGSFSLTASVGDILQVSYVGYTPESVKVTDQKPKVILLMSANNDLDEVVVIGYGTARKRDLTGAVGSVKGDELREVPVTTAAQALTGKVAGVNVVTQSGAPGADVNITVRGGTSITGSTKPLYVVDGFIMDDALMKIDANDIESIDILKDASATSIYGARGANGVVLITTKSAKSGKTTVNYNAYLSIEQLSRQLDLLGVEDYVKYQYEFQTLGGTQHSFADMYGGDSDAVDFASGAYARIHNDYANRGGIDWQEEVFGGSAMLQAHNVNISGGNNKTKLMLSYNNTSQDGILAKSGYRRNSVRAKIDHELFKGVNLDFNSLFQDANRQGGGSLGGMLKMSALQPATGGVRYTDEELLHTDISEQMSLINSQYDLSNPIIMNDARTRERATRFATINVGLTAKFLNDFTFRTQGSYQWRQQRTDFWDDGRTRDARNNGGPYGSIENNEGFEWQLTNTLSWLKGLDITASLAINTKLT